MIWYTTKPEPRLRNATVIIPPQGSGYDSVYHRVRLIWKHVYDNFPDYDFYMRVWDDNYVFPEAVQRVAESYDPAELLEIGNVFFRNHTDWGADWCKEKFNGTELDVSHISCPEVFMSGGCTSLLTGAALRKLGPELYKTCPDVVVVQEDVTMAICLQSLGVKYVDHGGFLSNSIRPGGMHPIFPSDISCKRKFVYDPHLPPVEIVTLHYVKYGAHENISLAEDSPCNASEEFRKEEVAKLGYWPLYKSAERTFGGYIEGHRPPKGWFCCGGKNNASYRYT